MILPQDLRRFIEGRHQIGVFFIQQGQDFMPDPIAIVFNLCIGGILDIGDL